VGGEQADGDRAGAGRTDEAAPAAADGSRPAMKLSLDRVQRAWAVILSQVKKKKVPLHSLLQEARPVDLEGKTLTIGFPAGSEFHKTQVEKRDNMAVLTEVLGEMTGAGLKVRCIISEGERRPEKKVLSHEEIIALAKEELKAEEVRPEPRQTPSE
jgi:hypothetical protein